MSANLHWLSLAAAILMNAGAQVTLKIGASRSGGSLNLITFVGLALFGLVTILAVFALQGIPLKQVMAANSLAFVTTPLAAHVFLGNEIALRNVISVGLILLGIVVFWAGG